MDYARKIGKNQTETWSKLNDCVPQKPCDSRKQITPLQEDRRLANWKRWLADRERRQKYLASALKREPIDLVLNSHEKVRQKNETKCLLEAAVRTEVTNQDKYRGNPAFWRTEEKLKKRCSYDVGYDDGDCDDDNNDLIVKKSRNDMFLPPDITRVALPAYIKKEKMLVETCADAEKFNLKSNWDCGKYLKHRRSQLQREIKYLEPMQPETEDLIVIGRNSVCQEKQQLIRIPVITIVPDESKRKLLQNPDDRAALKIQDREFLLESSRHFEKLSREKSQELRDAEEEIDGKKYVYASFCDCIYEIIPKRCKSITWTLNFLSKDNEICERKFYLENRGVRIVHVEWREVTPSFIPISIPERVDSQFFFNKSRISILPGQKVEVAVWFRADRPIFASETWQLIVDPKVYPGSLLLRLWATSSGENYRVNQQQQFNSVRELLECQVRNSKIREIIEDLIVIATTTTDDDDIPYEMYFLESQLFEARNPGYYFKLQLVNELKQMHKDASTCKQDWDLLLSSLKSSLLKIEDPSLRREKLLRFQAICHECLLPDFYYTRPKPSKERLVYLLLCMFVNRFEDEDDYVMRYCCREDVTDDDDEEEYGGVAETGDDESEVFITKRNLEVYKETMFIRIYCLLRETIDKICLAVESCDFFNK